MYKLSNLLIFEHREEREMPIVQITMAQGRTSDKKEELIKRVTDAIVEILQVPIDRVRIALYELPGDNIAFSGVPISKMDR